jgi:hypothetical protein
MCRTTCRIFLAAAALLLAGMASAAPRDFVSEDARAAIGDRAVHVVIAQAEIGTGIVPSRVTAATGGGLLFALVDASIESARAKKAEAAIQPVRAALISYDFDARAIAQLDTELAGITWFRALPATLTKDSSKETKLAALDSAPGEQVAFVDIRYGASPDFSAIAVIVECRIASRATPPNQQPDQRLRDRNLIYRQALHSVVMLPNPAKELEANAATWAADNERLAQTALDLAIDRLRDLIGLAVNHTEATAAAMRKGEKTRIGDYAGNIIESSEHGTVLYDRPDIVFVQTINP